VGTLRHIEFPRVLTRAVQGDDGWNQMSGKGICLEESSDNSAPRGRSYDPFRGLAKQAPRIFTRPGKAEEAPVYDRP